MAASLAPLCARAHTPHKNPPPFVDLDRYFVAPAVAAFAAPQAGLGNNSFTPPAKRQDSSGRGGRVYRSAVQQMTAQRLVASYYGEHEKNLNGSSVIGCGRWKAFGQKLAAEIKVDGDQATMEGHFKCGCSWTCQKCASGTVASNREWLEDVLFPGLEAAGLTGSLVTLTLSHSDDDWEVAVQSLKKAFKLMDRRMAKVYKKAGSIGKYKSFEVTVGRAGLHPHYHLLLTHKPGSTPEDHPDAPGADIEALKESMRSAWLAAVAEVGGYCDPVHGFDFQTDRLDTYVAKMQSSHELASQSSKKGRQSGKSLSQLLDAAGAGDKVAGAKWQRAIAALGATNRFHAGNLAKKLKVLTPTEYEAGQIEARQKQALEDAKDAKEQGLPEPTIIEYSLLDHLAATNPASGRAALALILRAARRGGEAAVLLMVKALVADNQKRDAEKKQQSCNHASRWAYNDS